jgi:hypothetical protein
MAVRGRSLFRTDAMARLWEGLRYAPPATLARMADDAEAYLPEVHPAHAYSVARVVERLTRYRPERLERADAEGVIPGEALVEDLARFVALATRRAPDAGAGAGGPLTPKEAAARLGVSDATLRRYHARGLVFRHVRVPGGGVELRVPAPALEAFAARHARLVQRAARTGRLGPEERTRLVKRASERLARGAASMHAVAVDLAAEFGRCPRTIRRVLERDAGVTDAAPRPAERVLDARAARMAARAWQAGHGPQGLAGRVGPRKASAAAWSRAIQRGRALELARAVARAHALALPNFERADSEATLLAPRAVREGLAAGPWRLPTPHLATPEEAREQGDDARRRVRTHPPDVARVVAQHFLLWRATRALAGTRRPPTDVLDGAERDLRWAYRLRRSVVEAALPDALARVAQHLGVPWRRLPVELQWKWAAAAATALGQALDFRALATVSVDDVRPRRAAALAVERMLSRPDLEALVQRTPAWLDASTVAPWMHHLDPGDRWSAWLAVGSPDEARVVERRFGLDGAPPATLRELGRVVRGSAAVAQARLYAALEVLRGAARGAPRREHPKEQDRAHDNPGPSAEPGHGA